jgi:hypothetical protein
LGFREAVPGFLLQGPAGGIGWEGDAAGGLLGEESHLDECMQPKSPAFVDTGKIKMASLNIKSNAYWIRYLQPHRHARGSYPAIPAVRPILISSSRSKRESAMTLPFGPHRELPPCVEFLLCLAGIVLVVMGGLIKGCG